MKTSIKEELTEHINDNIGNHVFSDKSDLHHHLFNSDYYIIGYYQAQEWLKEHKIHPLEAIIFIRNYELENFGGDSIDVVAKYMREGEVTYDYEKIVNMLTYIVGEELLSEMNLI